MASLCATKIFKSAVAVIVSSSLVVTTAVMPVAAQLNAVKIVPVKSAKFVLPTFLNPSQLVNKFSRPIKLNSTFNGTLGIQSPLRVTGMPEISHPIVTESMPGETPIADKPPNDDELTVKESVEKNGSEVNSLSAFLPLVIRNAPKAYDGVVENENNPKDALNLVLGSVNPALTQYTGSADSIVNNVSIPTPAAAKHVGAIRRALGTPLWAKVVAPVSVVAAVMVAMHVGAVPALTLAIGLGISVLAHEIAHIAVLHRLGDDTAERAGSHRLNPLAHIDAVSTVILPALSLALSSVLLPFPILLGAGKPVDANFNNLHSPFGGPRSARNAGWVAAAGPATNLLIAGAVALLPVSGAAALVAAGLIKMNLALAAFNLLPLPWLDGGKIAASLLPEWAYAKWAFNPHVERGYQAIFRRLYDGPSRLLTWIADVLGVRTQKGVNRLADAVTFASLAIFYAAAYLSFGFALPMIFLAVHSEYNYWCIREHVRSQAAVDDLMGLMNQWSAVISQIAAERGLKSEISAYETHHAMKNALEDEVIVLMAQDEFRNLSEDEKLEIFLKKYPEKAAERLKMKAMTEDSLEDIKAVLADSRNGPFYDMLRKWFKEYEVFEHWNEKDGENKLKEALHSADAAGSVFKKADGRVNVPIVAALALGVSVVLFPGWWVAHAAVALSGFGAFGAVLANSAETSPASPSKVTSHGKAEYSVGVILVKFSEAMTKSAIGDVLARHGRLTGRDSSGMYALSAVSAAKAQEEAAALAAEEGVEEVKVHPNVAAAMSNGAAPHPDAKIYEHERALVVKFSGASEEMIKDYAEVRRLRLINMNFGGVERAVLFEVPEGADFRATAQMLVDETVAAQAVVESVRPLLESPGDAPIKPSAKAAVVEEAPPKNSAIVRRDPAQAWLEYLQNTTLSDGISHLSGGQIEMMAELFKPVARRTGEKRAPIVGRGKEIKRIIPIITAPRSMRTAVMLVGAAGVGKTAIPEDIAEMIEDVEAATTVDSETFLQFERLKGRWLVELNIDAVLLQKKPVGVLTEILAILSRLNTGGPKRGNEVVVLMDEIHKFFLDQEGQKFANLLKGPLREGTLAVIATTTIPEFKKFIENDDALRRRFVRIDVDEPSVPETIAILRGIKGWLEERHDAVIPDEALVAAAQLADQFDQVNSNPDKAINTVKEAAELTRPENLRTAITLELRETWRELVVAVYEARQALIDGGIASIVALPVDLYNRITELVVKAEALYIEGEAVAPGNGRVTTEMVKRVISANTGVSSGQLNQSAQDGARYTQMEREIAQNVVNQDTAIKAISDAVRRNKAGLAKRTEPMGRFLLVGSSGVGKTELAKQLAQFLFNDPNAMIRLDMSEYMEKHTASRMIGSPPGYIGHEEAGQLTEAVRRKPSSVILFDEIEKAHPDVFKLLLQVLDDARLTDGKGRTVNFANTIIIMTSNAGMTGVNGQKYAELLAKVDDHNKAIEINKAWDEEIDRKVAEALTDRFPPEFLARFDQDPVTNKHWVRMNRLRPEDVAIIAGIQIRKFGELLADRHDCAIEFDESAVKFLAAEGYSPLYGARPLAATIKKHITDPLAMWVLNEAAAGRAIRGTLISFAYTDGRIVFKARPKPEKNTPRTTVQGAAEVVAARVLALIESLSSGEGEEPSETFFDQLMRSVRPVAKKIGEKSVVPGPRITAFLATGSRLSVPGAPLVTGNNPKKKDPAVNAAIESASQSAREAGWSAAVIDALNVPAGQVGTGWIKQITAYMKEQSLKAHGAAPVTLAISIEKDLIKLAVDGVDQLSEAEQRFLTLHFSGMPTASHLAATQKANALNMAASDMLWNPEMLDLYRRLSLIPGARMGFKTESTGAQIWLEIRRQVETSEAKPLVPPIEEKNTSQQKRETAKIRELMMKFVDQSRLAESDRDGYAIRIAAVEGAAMLAQPEDLAVTRELITAKGWATPLGAEMKIASPVAGDWPLAMLAARIFERFGGAEEVGMLENMASRVTARTDYETPIHQALTQALSAMYARLGLAATRQAFIRAANIPDSGQAQDMISAANRALGAVGMPADIDATRADAEGYLALIKRLGRQDELLLLFHDTKLWGENRSSEPILKAALKFVGETETSEAASNRLKNMMHTQTSYSTIAYEMARAWAQIVAREGLTRGLGDAVKRYLDVRGMKDHSLSANWPILYAYIVASSFAGGLAELAPLEEIMNETPDGISNLNEQSYFSAPDAWARSLLRSGKFVEYASSPGLKPDGSPKFSKLQEMLVNKTRPMLVAAALRAIAYERDSSLSRRAVEPKGDLPDSSPLGAIKKAAPPFAGGNPRLRVDWPGTEPLF